MKRRYPRKEAMAVAAELCRALKPVTERLVVAGSLRRLKAEVGDVEILFIPRRGKVTDTSELFAVEREIDLVVAKLGELLAAGVIEKRLNKDGSPAWGEWNKLARHRATGIPVDFFTATAANWWNYLVCRTGSAECNTLIAMKALERGWGWDHYSPGFVRSKPGFPEEREVMEMSSEEEVFRFVGLDYLKPEQRNKDEVMSLMERGGRRRVQ